MRSTLIRTAPLLLVCALASPALGQVTSTAPAEEPELDVPVTAD